MSLIIQIRVTKEILEFWVKRPFWELSAPKVGLRPRKRLCCPLLTIVAPSQRCSSPSHRLPACHLLPAERRNLSRRLSLLSRASPLRWRPPRSSRLVASWPSWWPAFTSSSAHSPSFPTHSGWSAAEVLEVSTVRFASEQSIQSRKVRWIWIQTGDTKKGKYLVPKGKGKGEGNNCSRKRKKGGENIGEGKNVADGQCRTKIECPLVGSPWN